MKQENHKPIIETIINTSALALTSFGVFTATANGGGWDSIGKGLILILFGGAIEWFKYWGRKEDYW